MLTPVLVGTFVGTIVFAVFYYFSDVCDNGHNVVVYNVTRSGVKNFDDILDINDIFV